MIRYLIKGYKKYKSWKLPTRVGIWIGVISILVSIFFGGYIKNVVIGYLNTITQIDNKGEIGYIVGRDLTITQYYYLNNSDVKHFDINEKAMAEVFQSFNCKINNINSDNRVDYNCAISSIPLALLSVNSYINFDNKTVSSKEISSRRYIVLCNVLINITNEDILLYFDNFVFDHVYPYKFCLGSFCFPNTEYTYNPAEHNEKICTTLYIETSQTSNNTVGIKPIGIKSSKKCKETNYVFINGSVDVIPQLV